MGLLEGRVHEHLTGKAEEAEQYEEEG